MKDDKPERHVGRDIKSGTHELTEEEKRRARAATQGEGLARSGGTPGEQKTTGSYHAGGTKITSEEQGRKDASGSPGAAGAPGAPGRKGKNQGRSE